MPSKYRLFGARGNGRSETEVDGYDSQEFMIQGASVALGLIKEAAELAPVPGLKQAAGIVLSILTAIQNIKDNKEGWKILSSECSAFIAVVWASYNDSSSKEDWPSPALRSVIQDLVLTLRDIKRDVEGKQERSLARKFVFNTSDVTKITEYRLKVRQAVTEFEVASHLSINEEITRLIRGQDKILKRLSEHKIQMDMMNTERMVGQIRDMTIQDPVDELEPELQAAAQRYLESERLELSKEKMESPGKGKRRATIDDEDQVLFQDDSSSREWTDEPLPKPKRTKSSHSQKAPASLSSNGESSPTDSMGASPSEGWSSASSMYGQGINQGDWNVPPPQYSQQPQYQGYPSPPSSNPASPGQPPNMYNFAYGGPPFFPQYHPYPTPLSPPFNGAPQQYQYSGYFPPGGPPTMGRHPITGLPFNQWSSAFSGTSTINNHGNSGNVTNNITKNSNNKTTTIYKGSKKHKK